MTNWQVIEGDCLDVMRDMACESVDAVVTDPPYGIAHDTNYTRFTGGVAASCSSHAAIEGDREPFDPRPWLRFPRVVLFGANCYSDRLPLGTWFVWDKRSPNGHKNVMSDGETAWYSKGHGIYIFNHTWDGFNRASERRTAHHPTQKPVALMEWVIRRLKLPAGATILDPYCGSGSTGVAAIALGYCFIGIESHAPYVEIARRRIAAAAQQPALEGVA